MRLAEGGGGWEKGGKKSSPGSLGAEWEQNERSQASRESRRARLCAGAAAAGFPPGNAVDPLRQMLTAEEEQLFVNPQMWELLVWASALTRKYKRKTSNVNTI